MSEFKAIGGRLYSFQNGMNCRCVLIPYEAKGSMRIIDPTGEPLPGDVEDEQNRPVEIKYSTRLVSTADGREPTEIDPAALEDAMKAVGEIIRERQERQIYDLFFNRWAYRRNESDDFRPSYLNAP